MSATASTMTPLGAPAPDFSLSDTDGKTVRRADLEGAGAAGARAIAVATGNYEENALRQTDAHAVLSDFSDTDAVVALLLGG